MSVDFEDLLNRPASDLKPPKTLPAGPYRFETVGLEFGKSSQKQTPFARVLFKVIEGMEGVDPDQLAEIGDLAKRSMRDDFYLTEDAAYRFVEFAKLLDVEDAENKTLKELCGAVKNGRFQIVGYVTHRPNNNAKSESDPKYYAEISRYAKL